jgi:hypothetical protein
VSVTLLPCPFCGGPPSLIAKWLDEKRVEWVNMPAPLPSDDGVFVSAWVFCHECGADGPEAEGICCWFTEIAEIEFNAVDNWNVRGQRHKDLYDVNYAEGRCRYPRRDL